MTDVPASAVAWMDPARDSAGLRRARRRALTLAIVLLSAAAVLSVLTARSPTDPVTQGIDNWWMALVEHHRHEWLVNLSKALSLIGSSIVMWPARFVAGALLAARRRWLQLGAFVTALVLSELCIGPLKAFIDRPRPPFPLVATSGAAFPSGHAIAAAVTSFGFVIAILPRGRRRVRWIALATSFSAAMAMSRTYLGAHWLTDTVAGACMGVGLALGVEVLFEQFRTDIAEIAELADIDVDITPLR